MVLAARGLGRLLGTDWGPLADPDRLRMVALGVVSALVVALGQVIGWIGYALPRLQERISALKASLVLGAVFTVWHLPMW